MGRFNGSTLRLVRLACDMEVKFPNGKPSEICPISGEIQGELPDISEMMKVEFKVKASEIMDQIWPKAFFVPECDQWHCSNCNAIFKQYSEPAISYCPWCGRRFIKIDPECMLSKHMAIPPEKYELSPKDICQTKHGVDSCGECEKCKE